ncbi:MAG: hypothetical protein KUL77_08085 [Thermomonas sp.]|uniref:hypothetical protein n=1 Tax=Thermomonas sp. TaxID=1971895 RepID=UPI001ECA9596|nr:hypothetical protein [Thermomonas sp.]MBV2209506.1 hypothetical protein [Thermomonas sp.]
MSAAPDDKLLRKAWLKQKFISYEYHEELLSLHQQWYDMIKRAFARPEVKRDYPDLYKYFQETAFKNFDRVAKPGQWTPEFYQAHRIGGAYRGIADYGQLMYPNYWEWMTDAEREATQSLWLKMLQMCTNIRQTVDNLWISRFTGDDDSILDDELTGPIDWPTNWREQILGPEAAALAAKDALCIKAGEPVPESGTYVALDPRDRRFTVTAGEQLPDLDSSYGITVWQRIAG